MNCPCGTNRKYEACCGRFHIAIEFPSTPEELMRSRYCAFVKQDTDYLRATTWPANQRTFDDAAYASRAANSIWLGLTIHETQDGSENDSTGTVTFTAKSMVDGNVSTQSEKSLFRKRNGRWYYVKPLE